MTTRIVIRGLILSAGMDELAEEIDATYTNWVGAFFRTLSWKWRGYPSEPIDIIGHSLGANAALRMANTLGDANVKVGLVCMLDPTAKQRIHHARLATAFLSSDIRAQPISGALNIIRNDLNHLNMTYDPKILGYIKDNLSEDEQ